MSALTIRDVHKRFGGTAVLKGIDLDIEAGEFMILVGPSGCGKSTLLALIAGLEAPDAGEIRIGDRVVNDLPPRDRDIAMVFQSYSLYPNMTVRQNISFGMEMRKVPKADRDAAVERVSQILQIGHLLDRRPAQLSGGQRQRVAMGRAIARDPTLFLFDEPLSNLDAKLRVEMRTEVKRLHHRLRTTIVYVTHDQIEAMTLGDRIAVMQAGAVQQLGTPQEIYDRPASLFVAGFMGSPAMNFIRAPVVALGSGYGVAVEAGGRTVTLPAANGVADLKDWIGKEVVLGIRPEQITQKVDSLADAPHIRTLTLPVEVIEPTGPDTLVHVSIQGTAITCRVHPSYTKRPGEGIELMLDLSKAVLFDPHSEARIV